MAESIYEHGALDLWSECTFCEQFLYETSRGVSGKVFDQGFKREIYEDQNFVVVAALGQIVEGWLLIIPRVHYTSIAELPKRFQGPFYDVTSRVRKKLREIYGSAVFFEHGSVSLNGSSGACIEHAHLHAVPASFDIMSALSQEFELAPILGLKGLWSSPPTQDYLYYEAANGDGFLIEPDHLVPCQYFRRLIARAIGRQDNWDWRAHIERQSVQFVTDELQGKL